MKIQNVRRAIIFLAAVVCVVGIQTAHAKVYYNGFEVPQIICMTDGQSNDGPAIASSIGNPHDAPGYDSASWPTLYARVNVCKPGNGGISYIDLRNDNNNPYTTYQAAFKFTAGSALGVTELGIAGANPYGAYWDNGDPVIATGTTYFQLQAPHYDGQIAFMGDGTHTWGCIADTKADCDGIDPTVVSTSSSLGQDAANLAKQLLNANYLLGGKGWDYEQSRFVSADAVRSGYNFWNQASGSIAFAPGVDCSGLIIWAYDRSFDPDKSHLQNFVTAEGADGQYRYNTTSTTESSLSVGDVMFFDFDNDKHMDHVAMYVGESGGYDVVSASGPGVGIVARNKDSLKNAHGFVAFKKVTSSSPAMIARARSAVDVVLTDPDGFTISPTTTKVTGEEFLREIPGALYYSASEKMPDGRPMAKVYSYIRKAGEYTLKIIPRAGTSMTSTYSLDFSAGDHSATLATNVPLGQAPPYGYGITLSPDGTLNTFTPIGIDIKPGTLPNSINLGSNGVLPVAIFGSPSLDVRQIDLTTIKLANASIEAKANGKLMASYSDINGDGAVDVVVQVSTQALRLIANDVSAQLTGSFFDGTLIKGSDSLRVVPQ